MKKELRDLIREIEARGYTVARDTGRYYKVRNGDGGVVFALPATPGRGRWMANLRAELRRKGVLE